MNGEEALKYAGPLKKRKNYFARFLVFAVAVVSVIFVLSLPLFTIKDIEISGNAAVSDDLIKTIAGLGGPQNIFAFSVSKAEASLLDNPYIKTVKIEKRYPDKINIEIFERKPRAYVEFKSVASYLLIDETGTVLDSASYAKEELPVVVGLKLTDMVIGQPLAAEDTKAFENVVLLSNLFDKYELTGRLRVELSDKKDMHLYIGTVDVLFGGIDGADNKIAMVKAILPEIPEGARGFLDVRDGTKNPVFKYLK